MIILTKECVRFCRLKPRRRLCSGCSASPASMWLNTPSRYLFRPSMSPCVSQPKVTSYWWVISLVLRDKVVVNFMSGRHDVRNTPSRSHCVFQMNLDFYSMSGYRSWFTFHGVVTKVKCLPALIQGAWDKHSYSSQFQFGAVIVDAHPWESENLHFFCSAASILRSEETRRARVPHSFRGHTSSCTLLQCRDQPVDVHRGIGYYDYHFFWSLYLKLPSKYTGLVSIWLLMDEFVLGWVSWSLELQMFNRSD